MFASFKDTYELYEKMEPAQRGPFATIVVFQTLLEMVYYVVLGLVVWLLGRQLIRALVAAYKEARRA